MVDMLLERSPDVNAPPAEDGGMTALQAAISYSRLGIVEILLEQGADVNAPPAERDGITALQAAAKHGFIELAVKLIERGASPAASTSQGKTAIDFAAEKGRLDMLQLLINVYDGQASIGVVCRKAAKYAFDNNHLEIAEWLENYCSFSSGQFGYYQRHHVLPFHVENSGRFHTAGAKSSSAAFEPMLSLKV